MGRFHNHMESCGKIIHSLEVGHIFHQQLQCLISDLTKISCSHKTERLKKLYELALRNKVDSATLPMYHLSLGYDLAANNSENLNSYNSDS